MRRIRLALSAGRRSRGLRAVPVALFLVICGSVFASAQGRDPGAGAVGESAGASGKSTAGTGRVGAGKTYVAKGSSKPPTLTSERRRQLRAAEARSYREGPRPRTLTAPTGRQGEPAPSPDEAAQRQAAAAAAPNALTTFRNTTIPAAGISGGYANVSNTQEPSTDANGKNVFQTGNWYASRSFNNGTTWSFLDPFSIFGAGFCCDQVALYDAARDVQFWLLQYSDHLTLVASKGDDLTNWCGWNVEPSWFGEPSTTEIDYNDLALSNDYIYLASNLFPAAGGAKSGMVRIPLDPFDPGGTGCAEFNFNFYTDANYFTFKPVQGATDTMYWGSNGGGTLGTSFRVYSWAENSTTVLNYDRTVPAFLYYSRNTGQNCASASGAVTNWCQFADSRVLGGYVTKDATGRGVIGFSFNAKQGGSFPFPYTRRVIFRESDKVYLSSVDHYSTGYAIQFMQFAPNERGHLGAVFAWGGGTGTTNRFPGAGAMVEDDYGRTYSFWLPGISNACTSTGGLPRWGDYLTARPYHPADRVWVGTGFRNVGGGPCVAGGRSEPHNVIFGRGRDTGAYTRWNTR